MKKMKLVGIILGAVILAGCGASKEPAQETAESLTQEQQDSIAADLESQMDAMLESATAGAGVELPEIAIDGDMTDPTEGMAEELDSMQDAMLSDFVGDIDLVGSWKDLIGERACMEVTENEDGSYAITIKWSNSADETAVWEISGTWDSEMGGMIYDDGTYYVVKNGNEKSEEETTDGAFMKEGDVVRWADSKIEKDAIFEKM